MSTTWASWALLPAGGALALSVWQGSQRWFMACFGVAVLGAGLRIAFMQGGARSGAGLVLAAIAVGSALALASRADVGTRTAAAATGGLAALATLGCSAPGTAHNPAALELLVAVVATALVALAWSAALSAVRTTTGMALLALALLWLPWGPGDAPVILWSSRALVTLSGTAAAAEVVGLAWTPATPESWANWPQLVLAAAATWIAASAAGTHPQRRRLALTAVAVLGALHIGRAWLLDNAPALPTGVTAVKAAAWRADFGLFALAAWRWFAVAALLWAEPGEAAADREPSWTSRAYVAVAAVGAAVASALASAWLGPAATHDPLAWALVAAVLAGAAWHLAQPAHPRLRATAIVAAWVCAAILAGGALAGWSVAGALS